MRFIFRSRWAALAWAAGICLTAAQFAGGDAAGGAVDAPGGTDGNATAALMSDLQ